ncbi:MAG: fluoride efflux transporter CrcB [Alphaproteobacteria bacterium]
MTAKMLIVVAGGGATGSAMRYLTMIAVARLFGGDFPWGTMVVNVLGSLVMGVLIEGFALKWQVQEETRAMLVVGILGGFTTFSTFTLDVAYLIQRGAMPSALAYIVGSVVIGVSALYAGMHLTRAVL